MSVLGKVLAGLLLAPVVILVGGIGGCEARKAYYDWQVRKLCEKDGGVRIIERVRLSRAEFDSLGKVDGFVSVPPEPLSKGNEPVFTRISEFVVRPGNPRVRRWEEIIVRRHDQKVVATVVSYARAGGDFPSPAEPSSFGCPDARFLYREREHLFEIEGN